MVFTRKNGIFMGYVSLPEGIPNFICNFGVPITVDMMYVHCCFPVRASSLTGSRSFFAPENPWLEDGSAYFQGLCWFQTGWYLLLKFMTSWPIGSMGLVYLPTWMGWFLLVSYYVNIPFVPWMRHGWGGKTYPSFPRTWISWVVLTEGTSSRRIHHHEKVIAIFKGNMFAKQNLFQSAKSRKSIQINFIGWPLDSFWKKRYPERKSHVFKGLHATLLHGTWFFSLSPWFRLVKFMLVLPKDPTKGKRPSRCISWSPLAFGRV